MMTEFSNLSFPCILSLVTEIIADNARSPVFTQTNCSSIECIPPLVPYGKCLKSSCCQLQPSRQRKKMRNKAAKKLMKGCYSKLNGKKAILENSISTTLRSDNEENVPSLGTFLTNSSSSNSSPLSHDELSSTCSSSAADCAPKKPCRVLSTQADLSSKTIDLKDGNILPNESPNSSITRNVSASSFAAILERRNTKISSLLKLLDLSRKDTLPNAGGRYVSESSKYKLSSSAASSVQRTVPVVSYSAPASIGGCESAVGATATPVSTTVTVTGTCSDHAPKKPHRVISNHATLNSYINETLSIARQSNLSSSHFINQNFDVTNSFGSRKSLVNDDR
jgi:hypothetical protein